MESSRHKVTRARADSVLCSSPVLINVVSPAPHVLHLCSIVTAAQLSITCCGALWPGGHGPLWKCCWLCGSLSLSSDPLFGQSQQASSSTWVHSITYKKDSTFGPLSPELWHMSMNRNGGGGGQLRACKESNGLSILPSPKSLILSSLVSELWSLDLCPAHL